MQHSSNVTFQCQGQQQVTVAQHQHTVPPLAPINTTSSGAGLVLDAGHATATSDEYDEYHNLSEFSFDSINGAPSDSLMENGHLNEEKMLPHSQSVGSEQMLYDNESGECFDMESGMHDDGSNGSGSSGGSSKSRTGSKKTGSSKNYIGKQNLFQEFQSEDVAKVRDSENQYIIGKSSAHCAYFCTFD